MLAGSLAEILYHCIVVSFYHCIVVYLYCFVIVLLLHSCISCIVVLLYYFIIVLLYCIYTGQSSKRVPIVWGSYVILEGEVGELGSCLYRSPRIARKP